MNKEYKKFIVDDLTYIFNIEDFEIFSIPQDDDIEDIIKQIKTEKEKSSSAIVKIKNKNLKYNFSINNYFDNIGIDLTNGCNLNCTYCFITASSKPRKMLNKAKFLDILYFLKNKKNHKLTFYFTGAGEPTLNFKLLKQIPFICKENGFEKCSFDLTTNGTILTQEMIEYFKLNKFKIHISLDGDKKTHDASRIYHDESGSFKDVFNNINLLKKNNIKILCKTVLHTDSKRLVDVFSFFEKNKIKFIFSFATLSFDNSFLPETANFETFKEQMDIVIEKYRKLIEDNYNVYAVKIMNDLKRIHYGGVNKDGCGGSKEGFFIDIDGDIYPCSYHSESKDLSIGSIYDGIDYKKIIKNKWYAKPVDNYESCKNCWMKYLCSGSCFAIKWLENKNTDIPSEYLCKTQNIYWNAIIKLYIQIYPEIISGSNINFKKWNS